MNVYIQGFSAHFPYFLPVLTLSPKWTPTSLKGYTQHLSSNIHTIYLDKEKVRLPVGEEQKPLRPQE